MVITEMSYNKNAILSNLVSPMLVSFRNDAIGWVLCFAWILLCTFVIFDIKKEKGKRKKL